LVFRRRFSRKKSQVGSDHSNAGDDYLLVSQLETGITFDRARKCASDTLPEQLVRQQMLASYGLKFYVKDVIDNLQSLGLRNMVAN